jgi:dihydrofolate reductase
MTISLIVAKSENNAIGKDNDLLWHLPADMKYFRNTTMGHFVVMGRKTLESFDKPLPGRTTIVVTRNNHYRAEGCLTFHSISDAIKLGQEHKQKEIFVLGGAEIYKQALDQDLIDKMYITEVKAVFENADAFFPEYDLLKWKETKREEHEPDEKNEYAYSFVELERIK